MRATQQFNMLILVFVFVIGPLIGLIVVLHSQGYNFAVGTTDNNVLAGHPGVPITIKVPWGYHHYRVIGTQTIWGTNTPRMISTNPNEGAATPWGEQTFYLKADKPGQYILHLTVIFHDNVGGEIMRHGIVLATIE
jgi:hypothetical protein